jgi:hypothetical protein
MKVISVGDKIDLKLKVLGIHSHFNHAINIYTDKGLVFIVSKDVGSGPNSIVLDENNLRLMTFRDLITLFTLSITQVLSYFIKI